MYGRCMLEKCFNGTHIYYLVRSYKHMRISYTHIHLYLQYLYNTTEEHLLSPKRTSVIPYRTPAYRSRRVMKGTVTYVGMGREEKKMKKKQ